MDLVKATRGSNGSSLVEWVQLKPLGSQMEPVKATKQLNGSSQGH